MTTFLESAPIEQQQEEEEAEEGTQAILVALRTRPFLPSEVEKAGERTLERGVEVKGKDMIVKLNVKKVSLGPCETTREAREGGKEGLELTIDDPRLTFVFTCFDTSSF